MSAGKNQSKFEFRPIRKVLRFLRVDMTKKRKLLLNLALLLLDFPNGISIRHFAWLGLSTYLLAGQLGSFELFWALKSLKISLDDANILKSMIYKNCKT